MTTTMVRSTFLQLTLVLVSCRAVPEDAGSDRLSYVGSSTVGLFMADARGEYERSAIDVDTSSESAGGEKAVLEGRANLGGTARVPPMEVLKKGVVATLLGRDAIAVIVNDKLPVSGLTREQLSGIFSGRLTNWAELLGPDLPISRFVVANTSATYHVFQAAVLGTQPYGASCTTVEPDSDIPDVVGGTEGAIGCISMAFLNGRTGVRAISVDGEKPAATNFDYPIYRPLYLLWRESDATAKRFVDWAESDEGQRLFMKRFVGFRVVASLKPEAEGRSAQGYLIVKTAPEETRDGDLYYYPHGSYEICRPDGSRIRRVANHLSPSDEQPTRVRLDRGTYLVRTRGRDGGRIEFLVTIEPEVELVVDVDQLVGNR